LITIFEESNTPKRPPGAVGDKAGGAPNTNGNAAVAVVVVVAGAGAGAVAGRLAKAFLGVDSNARFLGRWSGFFCGTKRWRTVRSSDARASSSSSSSSS
jgi:hypothetical protein